MSDVSKTAWSEEELVYLKQAIKDNIPRKEIAAKLGRSVGGVVKKIARLDDEAFEKLSIEEKHAYFRRMCEYYMNHEPEKSAAAACQKFGISTNFYTHMAYSPSVRDRSVIAAFQESYDHFRDIYGVDAGRLVLSEEDLAKIRKMYCEQNMTLTAISKKIDVSTRIISDAVYENGWKQGGVRNSADRERAVTVGTKITPQAPVRNAVPVENAAPVKGSEASVKGSTASATDNVFLPADPANYMEIAKPVVDEYNRTLDWYQQISREYLECKNNIDKLFKALVPLKL